MASIAASRINRASCLISRITSRSPIQLCGKRCLTTSACLRYQATSAKSQLPEVPAEKYQTTTITEDLQRSSARQTWTDPREANKGDQTHSSDEAMMDPTIRHFTVNFVRSSNTYLYLSADNLFPGTSAPRCSWSAPPNS